MGDCFLGSNVVYRDGRLQHMNRQVYFGSTARYNVVYSDGRLQHMNWTGIPWEYCEV